MEIASWNVNSIKVRLEQVLAWLEQHRPDVLLLQELKGTEFPRARFEQIGYASDCVTQKAYNGVATLSRLPMQTLARTLPGSDSDIHSRFLEVLVDGIRIVNIYLPNGNPVGTEKFDYKLDWMDRLLSSLSRWKADGIPTVVGGDFNVIPEDIDCHKPSSWMSDALFQPESRGRFRAMLDLGYVDAFRTLHPGEAGQFTFWDYFRKAFENNRGVRIDHFLLSPALAPRLAACTIDQQPRAQAQPSDHTPVVLTLV